MILSIHHIGLWQSSPYDIWKKSNHDRLCCWDEFIYCSINADEARSKTVAKEAAHTANLHDMSLPVLG